MLDIRQLYYFVTVAEEEHVARAAERLHISQSPLSRQIAQLEEKLGLTLFERKAKRIKLTTDGQTFLKEAKALLTHAKRLESLGQRLGRGDEGGLCIGYVDSAMYSSILPDYLRNLRQDKPNTHVALYNQTSHQQLEGLLQRSLDIALVDELQEGSSVLSFAKIYDDPMLLALADDHPLLLKNDIQIEDIKLLSWLSIKGQSKKSFIDICAVNGFSPNIIAEVDDPISALGLVAAGTGVAMIQQSLKQQLPKNVTTLSLIPLSYNTSLWVAWHNEILRPLVKYFQMKLTNKV
tara:strand:+ start:65590 stop:66465 length:876 start_codon:yes stop_codon:yes gene_type:complete